MRRSRWANATKLRAAVDSFLRIIRTARLHDRILFGLQLSGETGFERVTQHVPQRAMGARRPAASVATSAAASVSAASLGTRRETSRMRELPAR